MSKNGTPPPHKIGAKSSGCDYHILRWDGRPSFPLWCGEGTDCTPHSPRGRAALTSGGGARGPALEQPGAKLVDEFCVWLGVQTRPLAPRGTSRCPLMHARAPCVPAFGARLALAAKLPRGTFFVARAILTMRTFGPAQMLTKPNMAISGYVTAPLLYSGRAMYWQSKYCHISCVIPVNQW